MHIVTYAHRRVRVVVAEVRGIAAGRCLTQLIRSMNTFSDIAKRSHVAAVVFMSHRRGVDCLRWG